MIWLSPLWLAALAALAIPILIHLRRRRIGRRIQVGSVRHLAGAAMPRRRRLRLRDPWLLALRCAILALVAFALAAPAIRRAERPASWMPAADPKGKAIGRPDRRHYTAWRSRIIRRNNQFHRFSNPVAQRWKS